MRAIVLDCDHELHRQCLPPGLHPLFIDSFEALSSALRDAQRDDVLIVRVVDEAATHSLVDRLRDTRFPGAVIALVDGGIAGGIDHLKRRFRMEFLEYPPSREAMERVFQNAPTADLVAAPEQPSGPMVRRRLSRFPEIVGQSKQLQDVFARVEKAAVGDANICIYGESGTGKELIARAIHAISDRRDRPLVTFDCTAVPDGLMESQLFGHVRGAFTGAVEHREGVFSLADTGTLFIDELSELSLPLQAKLLRVIQGREFVKVGGTKPIRTNIRLITATNKDPKKAVDAGTFRADLYYRIAVVMIKLPPLRERRNDIPLLIRHFVNRYSAAYQKPIRAVEPHAMERLVAMSWPGNVRQLENFVAQAVVLADEDTLTERDLFVDDYAPSAVAPGTVQFEPGLPLRDVERHYIVRTLQRVQGNRTEAARLLGISVRCLQYKLKAYAQAPERPMAGGAAGEDSKLIPPSASSAAQTLAS